MHWYLLLYLQFLLGAFLFKDGSTASRINLHKSHHFVDSGSEEAKKKRKFKKGDTLVYCQILRLTDRDKKKQIMVVFANSVIRESKMRSRMKIDYMLKRERVYLHKVFFFDVDILDEQRVDTTIKEYMNAVQLYYPNAKIWGILNADGFLAENRL